MNQINLELKTKLFNQIAIVGEQQSLLPFGEPDIDETIRELEKINTIEQPLLPDNFSLLTGDWQLVYASNGTVVTRQIQDITNVLGSGIKVQKIWQSLTIENEKIIANNQALIELFLIGEYQLKANGIWKPKLDRKTASVSFNVFSLQATKFFSQSNWTLPELQIPVLDFITNEAIWITSYLDEDTRIGRGETGNLFVFRR